MTTHPQPNREPKQTGELVALLSKQTRSSMHTILGMLQLISDSPLSTSQQGHVRTCRMAADNLLRTVDDISGRTTQPELSNSPRNGFDLRLFLEKVEGVFRPAAEARGRSLRWTIHPGVPDRVAVSEALLERFVIRLIGRALELTGPEIAVEIEAHRPPGLRDQETILTVRLTCTGLEITDSALADALGVAITRQMAGWLGAEMETGNAADGTLYVVSRIPMQLPSSSSTGSDGKVIELQQDPRSGVVGRMRILVADDSDDAYLLVETYLKTKPCTLVRARDGAEAVKLGLNDSFDLILMDIDMPGYTGYEATQRIRSEETMRGSRRTPIVVLSAETLQSQMNTGSKVGCSGYLTKPVTQNVLVRVLERYQVA